MDILINTASPLTAFYSDFTGVGVSGLTVTIDIYNPSNSLVVAGGLCTDRAGGFYNYSYTPTVVGFYRVLFKVSVTTVAQQQLPLGFFCRQYDASTLTTAIAGLPTVGQTADAVWDEVLTGATHNVPSSAGRRLRQIHAPIIIEGTVVSATANSITFDGVASSNDGAYDPGIIYIVAGTGAGQSRIIIQYEGATKTAIVHRNWGTIPDNSSEYIIGAYAELQCVNEGRIRAASSTTIQLNTAASSVDNEYNGQGIFLVSGTGQDQLGVVRSYDGITKTATIYGEWETLPDTTTGYAILPLGLEPILSLMYDNSGEPTPIIIPVPTISNVCRVYEFVYDQPGALPQDSALMSAKIVSLPFDYNGKLHAGTVVTASKTTPDGNGNYAIYWDLPYTAHVTVYLSDHGVHKQIEVPEQTTARLAGLI